MRSKHVWFYIHCLIFAIYLSHQSYFFFPYNFKSPSVFLMLSICFHYQLISYTPLFYLLWFSMVYNIDFQLIIVNFQIIPYDFMNLVRMLLEFMSIYAFLSFVLICDIFYYFFNYV